MKYDSVYRTFDGCSGVPTPEAMETMTWEYLAQNRISRNDIPDEFRGTTVWRSTCGNYVKILTDYGYASKTQIVVAR